MAQMLKKIDDIQTNHSEAELNLSAAYYEAVKAQLKAQQLMVEHAARQHRMVKEKQIHEDECEDAAGIKYIQIAPTMLVQGVTMRAVLSKENFELYKQAKTDFLSREDVQVKLKGCEEDDQETGKVLSEIRDELTKVIKKWIGDHNTAILLIDTNKVFPVGQPLAQYVKVCPTSPTWNPVNFLNGQWAPTILPGVFCGRVLKKVVKTEIEPGKPLHLMLNQKDMTIEYEGMKAASKKKDLRKAQQDDFDYLSTAPLGTSYEIELEYMMHAEGRCQKTVFRHVPAEYVQTCRDGRSSCYPDKPFANVAAFAAIRMPTSAGKADARAVHLATSATAMEIKYMDCPDAPTPRLLVQILQISSPDTVDVQVWQKGQGDTKTLVTMSRFPMKSLQPVFVHDKKGATDAYHAPECIQECFDRQILTEAFPYPDPDAFYKTGNLPAEVITQTGVGVSKKGGFGRVLSVDKVQGQVTMSFKYFDASNGGGILEMPAILPVDRFWLEYSTVADIQDKKEHFDVLGMASPPKVQNFAKDDLVLMKKWIKEYDSYEDMKKQEDQLPWEYFQRYGQVVEVNAEEQTCKVEYTTRLANNPEGTEHRFETYSLTFSFETLSKCAKLQTAADKEKVLSTDEWKTQPLIKTKGPSKAKAQPKEKAQPKQKAKAKAKGKAKGKAKASAKKRAADGEDEGMPGKRRKSKPSAMVEEDDDGDDSMDMDGSSSVNSDDDAAHVDEEMDELPTMNKFHRTHKQALFNNEDITFLDMKDPENIPESLSTFQILGYGGDATSIVDNENATFHLVDDRFTDGKDHIVRVRMTGMTPDSAHYDIFMPALDVLLVKPNPAQTNEALIDGLQLQINDHFHQDTLKENKLPWTVGCTFCTGTHLLRVIYRDADGDLIAHRAGCYWSPTSIEPHKVLAKDQEKHTVVAPPRITLEKIKEWKSANKSANVSLLEDYDKWLPEQVVETIKKAIDLSDGMDERTIYIDNHTKDTDDAEMEKHLKLYRDSGIMDVELARVTIDLREGEEMRLWVPCSAMNLLMIEE